MKSKEMKNLPELRFPDFLNEPEWEIKPLKKLAENLDNKRVPITSNIRSKGNIPYYGASGIVDFVNDYIFDEELLCISEDGANLVVRTYPIAFSISGKTWVNNHAHVLKFKNKYTQIIVENYLNSIKLDDFLTGMAQPKLNKAMLDIIPIPISSSTDEQQKIANCLSSIDNLITAQSEKVEALKEHKKGLMQQLFPQDEEEVPKLRFPEFKNAPKWEEKQLGGISQILRGGSPRPIESYLTANEDGLNWLKIGDINKDSKYVLQTQEKVLPTALSKTREVNPGDLILSNSMSFGRPYILKIKACIHDGWIAITKIDQKFDRDFLYYFISSDASQTYFSNNAAGAAVLNLNAEIIKLLPIFAPKKEEQQKIANCLSSIDELITSQTKKVETLNEHKKGLMQQLFPSKEVK
ncbi:MAG: restriction endonuclease subunit S [Sulfurimonas sp.]|nr:restriction endonuclease subunit S [Sulfurimonas sp.]